jgi:carboxyl-terminal processing protease
MVKFFRYGAGAALAIVFAAVLVWKGLTAGAERPAPDPESLAALEKVRQIIVTNYVDRIDERRRGKMLLGAIAGMAGALDEHSMFLQPKENDQIRTDLGATFGGIGIELNAEEGTGLPLVAMPIVDTPAWEADMRAGDVIEAVKEKGDESYVELKDLAVPEDQSLLDVAMPRIKGRPGTQVCLMVRRPGAPARIEFTLTRMEIKKHCIADARMIDGRIGYIRLNDFSDDSTDRVKQEIGKLREQGMEALALDLRLNRGGYRDSAITLGSLFLRKGLPVMSTRGREPDPEFASSGRPPETYRADGSAPYPDLPLAVIVDGDSASSTEIFAGAVKDHGRAAIVGSYSFGKGSVQSMIPIPIDATDESGRPVRENCALKLTTYRWYRPNGMSGDEAIQPDYAVDIDDKERHGVFENFRRHWTALNRKPGAPAPAEAPKDAPDRQLDKAVEILQMQLDGAPLPPKDPPQPKKPKKTGGRTSKMPPVPEDNAPKK